MAQIATVSCQKQRGFCSKYQGTGDMTIRVFPSDSSKSSVSLGSGLHNANYLVSKILSHLENYVKKISSSNWETITQESIKEKKHIFLLFSSRDSISALLKSLSAVRI